MSGYRRPNAPWHGGPKPWLEVIEGAEPILLVAPHGGHAGHASRATISPKVNDLFTAEITRELAGRLGACAIINTGMDRNQLDLNRLGQLAEKAPWMLELLRARVASIVERFGHATVLIVHGWNIIQPRVDIGLGLRHSGNELVPAGSARISAADAFIHGRLTELGERLGTHGILTTFGLRYPAGGSQNLLQAFTERYRTSPIPALAAIAEISARRAIDAAQLELSVGVRMPGELRTRCVGSIAEVFSSRAASRPARFTVRRTPRVHSPASEQCAPAVPAPTRVGIEFYDPGSGIGAIASFDLVRRGAGARLMVLLPGGRVALFTGEGGMRRADESIALGPLRLVSRDDKLQLSFRGPAVIVPDATAYLSIERALGSGRLDEAMEVEVELRPLGCGINLDTLIANCGMTRPGAAPIAFGHVGGRLRADAADVDLGGFGRGGVSFTALGAAKFTSRGMIWACFDDGNAPHALELRSVRMADTRGTGRILDHEARWVECALENLEIDTPSVASPPHRLHATYRAPDGLAATIKGSVDSFVPLSQPGPDNTRIFTSLGFARFTLGKCIGAGMFEFSRRSDGLSATNAEQQEDESES